VHWLIIYRYLIVINIICILKAIVVEEFPLNPQNGHEIDGPNRAINFIDYIFGSTE
jgi:hypothetical protein